MRYAVLRVPLDEAELGADRLWCAGARAVEERDPGDGHVELATTLGDDDNTSRTRLGDLPTGWLLTFEEVDPTPANTWRDFAVPIVISDQVTIRPAWLPPTGAPVEAAIEPVGAFGLGDHPTTRLSAAAMIRVVSRDSTVLDVGCGTGVLCVLAKLLGAGDTIGIDIADIAVAATRGNAALNGVDLSASTTPLADVDGVFDIVVANILAPTLVALAGDLKRVLARHGTLVISGILAQAHAHVLEALLPLEVVHTDEHDGWVAVVLRWPTLR